MTVTPDIEAEIRRLYFAEHWRRGTIGAQLGLHDDVIKRVIGPTGRGVRISGNPTMIC